LLGWCGQLPEDRLGGWLCYWLAVASLPDDVAAEHWLARAWLQLEQAGDIRGLCLTAARAVLVKTDSWRTHHGLATWTQRALGLLDRVPPELSSDEALLILVGMLHASDFAEEFDIEVGGRIAGQILDRLVDPSGSTSPWVLGLWLVSFGSVCGRYFSYARRGFPYDDAEQALRAAIAIGEREQLRSVEFGALYHLQLQLKLRNELDEFGGLVNRLVRIADSRNSTQVAVAADCRAALHTLSGDISEAYRDCDRFMAAIEAAGEPPIERWPHFITRFQVLLADRKGDEASAWLGGLIDMFEGAVRDRTRCCMTVAEALAAKWRDSDGYPALLQDAITSLRATGWSSILANMPATLSELLADALRHDIDPDFCRQLIAGRALNPPPQRPCAWPWPLKIHVLGQFRVELDGEPLKIGAKTPARSLDILRALAAARDHVVPLAELHDTLWPDADGAQAKAACDQALHRLRKLLGRADLLIQRDGKLWLSPHHCWVDLDEWEHRLATSEIVLARRALEEFPGPLLPHEGDHPLWTHAAVRVRRAYLDLAGRLDQSAPAEADAVRSRIVVHYPDEMLIPA
jgi:LuxR family transcriptional regulator, maltose regulon positive regulatory protein